MHYLTTGDFVGANSRTGSRSSCRWAGAVLGSKMAAPQRFRNCQRIFETALRRLKLAAIPPQSLSLNSCSPPNSFDVTPPPEPMCLLPLE